MKKIVLISTLFLFFLLAVPAIEAKVNVKGYTRKNGTYVAPHYRSSPNKSNYDNWSMKGNINPYTGKKGSRIFK